MATKDEIHELIQDYLQRHDEEIEQLEKERNGRHKRPKSSRQITLESLIESEKSEYASGLGNLTKGFQIIVFNKYLLELPDMTNGKALKLLREWDGDKNGMTRIATMRIQKIIPDESNASSSMSVDTKKQPKPSNDDKDMMEL